MFTYKELEETKDYCERKIDDVLNKEGGPDADYMLNLQTLITLKDVANQKIQPGRKKNGPTNIEKNGNIWKICFALIVDQKRCGLLTGMIIMLGMSISALHAHILFICLYLIKL